MGDAAMKNDSDAVDSLPGGEASRPPPEPLRDRPPLDANSITDRVPPARRDGDRTVGRRGSTHGRALDTWTTRERGRGRRE